MSGGDARGFAAAVDRTSDGVGDFGGGALKRPSIAEQVTDRILAMVKSGNLRAGDRLPTEAQMGVAFGISRPPLREALKALTLIGVLESRQGGRYSVTDLSPARLMAPLNLVLSAVGHDVTEHFEARALVDLELVRLAALRATDEERARLVRLAQDGRAFHGDPVAFRLHDLEYHGTINAAARQPVMTALAQGLYDIGLDMRRVASALPGVIETSVAQHCEIAAAVAEGRAGVAASAYRRHLEHVRDTTIRSIELTAEEPPHG